VVGASGKFVARSVIDESELPLVPFWHCGPPIRAARLFQIKTLPVTDCAPQIISQFFAKSLDFRELRGGDGGLSG